MGSQGGKGWWQNPVHPNASSVHFANSDPGCPAGCGASLCLRSRVSRLSCSWLALTGGHGFVAQCSI